MKKKKASPYFFNSMTRDFLINKQKGKLNFDLVNQTSYYQEIEDKAKKLRNQKRKLESDQISTSKKILYSNYDIPLRWNSPALYSKLADNAQKDQEFKTFLFNQPSNKDNAVKICSRHYRFASENLNPNKRKPFVGNSNKLNCLKQPQVPEKLVIMASAYKTIDITNQNKTRNKSSVKRLREKQMILDEYVGSFGSGIGVHRTVSQDHYNGIKLRDASNPLCLNEKDMLLRYNNLNCRRTRNPELIKKGNTVEFKYTDNTIEKNLKDIENPEVRNLVMKLNGYGPMYSHCQSCSSRNVEFYNNFPSGNSMKILTDKRRKTQIK